MNAEQLVSLAGWLQVAHLIPLLVLPGILRLRPLGAGRATDRWPGLHRAGGMLAIAGLGLVIAGAPREVVGGGRLGIGVCALLGGVFAVRAALHFALYRRSWPRSPALARAGYYLVGAYFASIAFAYGVGLAAALGRRG